MASATINTVTVGPFDPNATSLQSDIIAGATSTKAGVMTAAQAAAVASLSALTPAVIAELLVLIALSAADAGPKMFSNLTRPPANDPQFADAFADNRVAVIWNTDDKAPNYSDGVNWYDASGNLT